ncbi:MULTISPECIES: helix-turn-helix domain-containing protein [Spirosoma]|uniref:AraC family transcriptional regulator n=1 Tax=Spirosoma sordidisoli TaxID=2502893 RepID=A0A4Q2UJU5_9BACT|nr:MULTISPECIES: helix-turn-helix transcriptional regulator [Spirosoma]PHK24289.1 AraC family transcriptional regulator [Nostoc linckia z16]RYC68892.1 AraC family transcriptional regulator [Spirosoma sordidisoli]
MKQQSPHLIHSISEQHRILGLPKPVHPLISVFNFDDIDHIRADKRPPTLLLDLYCISLKRNVTGKVRYGQGYCDFDEGILFCTAPGQVTSNITDDHKPSGWCVVFHPDFIRGHPFCQRIKQYGFFDYTVNEALHLSDQEETLMISVMNMLRHEINSRIDQYSEAVLIAHLYLLLSYTQRFYSRQFITRKPISHDVLIRLETILSDYFASDKTLSEGLPSVSYLAEKMNYSDSYLSDLLKTYTGQNTQQHIHRYVIERAKELLTQTRLSVSEIGLRLGFTFPQSFSRLFKNKTNVTPLQYRQSFN